MIAYRFITSLFTRHQRLKKLVLGFLLLLTLTPSTAFAISAPTLAKHMPVQHFAAATTSIAGKCTHTFLGLEPWYKFIPDEEFYGSGEKMCDLKCFNFTGQNDDCGVSKSDVPLVLLAVIDDLLRIAGLVAVGFVLYGAFQFVGSQGNPDGTARAQSTVIDALLGLAVATIAVAVVAFIGHKLGGT